MWDIIIVVVVGRKKTNKKGRVGLKKKKTQNKPYHLFSLLSLLKPLSSCLLDGDVLLVDLTGDLKGVVCKMIHGSDKRLRGSSARN